MLPFTQRKRRARRGFSLPEVMLAIAIMGYAVAVFVGAFPASGNAISRSRHRDLAASACQQQLEFWRNIGYSSLPAVPSGATGVTVSFTPPATLPRATGSVRFTRVDDSFRPTAADTGRVQVDATVSWERSGSDRGSVTLTTLILR